MCTTPNLKGSFSFNTFDPSNKMKIFAEKIVLRLNFSLFHSLRIVRHQSSPHLLQLLITCSSKQFEKYLAISHNDLGAQFKASLQIVSMKKCGRVQKRIQKKIIGLVGSYRQDTSYIQNYPIYPIYRCISKIQYLCNNIQKVSICLAYIIQTSSTLVSESVLDKARKRPDLGLLKMKGSNNLNVSFTRLGQVHNVNSSSEGRQDEDLDI